MFSDFFIAVSCTLLGVNSNKLKFSFFNSICFGIYINQSGEFKLFAWQYTLFLSSSVNGEVLTNKEYVKLWIYLSVFSYGNSPAFKRDNPIV